jgi:hypothetical protein
MLDEAGVLDWLGTRTAQAPSKPRSPYGRRGGATAG